MSRSSQEDNTSETSFGSQIEYSDSPSDDSPFDP